MTEQKHHIKLKSLMFSPTYLTKIIDILGDLKHFIEKTFVPPTTFFSSSILMFKITNSLTIGNHYNELWRAVIFRICLHII